MKTRTLPIAGVTLALTMLATAASAGGAYSRHYRPAPDSYYGPGVYAPYADRSTGHPIYASPSSGSNLEPSMGGRTGTYGDDGVSGY